MLNIEKKLVQLSLIDKVGPATILKLLKTYKENISEIESFSLEQFINAGLSKELSLKIFNDIKDNIKLEKELYLAAKNNIKIVTILSEYYPENLKNIEYPPIILYCKGEYPNKFTKCMAVVGSRQCDDYALIAIKKLLPDLIHNNWTIVSGGALGVDSLAHKICLYNKSSTISVIGSGLLKLYPTENKKLFQDISESGGSIISCFSLTAPGLPANFPARNRIISGLSSGCIVIQAAQKSGALITAKFALEQNRQVFAVPSNIDNPLGAGCNDLISQGAIPLYKYEQIAEVFYENIKNKPEKSNQKNNFSEDQNLIINILKTEKNFDQLIQESNFDIEKLQTILIDLEIEGIIQKNSTGSWSVKDF